MLTEVAYPVLTMLKYINTPKYIFQSPRKGQHISPTWKEDKNPRHHTDATWNGHL